MDTYELVKFVDNEFSLDVNVDYEKETVWLTQKQMSQLFLVSIDNVSLHIKNIMKDGELDDSVIEEFSATASDGKRYRTKFYNLDMIISVGYRVKSKRGIEFRRWATKVLKDYLLKGAAVNERRIAALNKTVEIQNRILSGALSIDEKELSSVIESYTKALDLLDDYDYQRLKAPETNKEINSLTYEETRKIIDSMKFKENSSLFGVEKEKGKLNGIIQAINQSAFGEDIYPSLEEKAANLLYFLVKDHPFVDGCKRIAATLFLEYLNRNKALVRDGKLVLSNDAVCAITILTAESKPEEKDIIVNVIMRMISK